MGIESLFGVFRDYKRILTLHHLSNTLVCLAFYFAKILPPLCRFVFGEDVQPHIESIMLMTTFPFITSLSSISSLSNLQSEHQIFIFLAFVIFWKNRRATSWFHYVSTVFVFTKLANLILFYRIDPRVAILYGLICIGVSLLFPEPAYTGPEQIVYFRGPNLKEELERDPRVTWLIEFYVSWSPECSQVAPVFAQLSEKYNLPNLKFGKLDVGKYGDEAERFRINNHPTSRQLPTFSLFRGGKEVKRRPVVNAQGRAIRYVFSQENVIMDFDLNNLKKECEEALPKFLKRRKDDDKDSAEKKEN